MDLGRPQIDSYSCCSGTPSHNNGLKFLGEKISKIPGSQSRSAVSLNTSQIVYIKHKVTFFVPRLEVNCSTVQSSICVPTH